MLPAPCLTREPIGRNLVDPEFIVAHECFLYPFLFREELLAEDEIVVQ